MRSFSFSLFSAFKALPFWGSLFLLFNLMGCNPLDKNPSEISITSLSSTTGSSVGGSTITITGSNFVFIEGVNFGAKACTNVLLLDSSHLTCTVPRSDVGSATVSVVVYGKANRSASIPYTYVQVDPSITSFSPTAGALAAGTTINLIGAGFDFDSTVSIDGAACTSPVLASSTSLSCVLPARPAGSYSVVVTNYDGTSSTSVGLYTYQAAPTISGVSPAFGTTAGSTTLTIIGTGFLAGATVSIGGTPCSVTLVTPPNSISCLTLPKAAGIFDVKVTNLDLQQAAASSAFAYTFPPTPASVSPTSGALLGGTTITIYGSGFVTGATVSVGGSICTSPTVLNSSIMTCVTPGPKVAGAYSVVVTNPSTLTGTLIAGYTYQPAPSLTSVSPNAGSLTGGTSVTLTGSNFLAIPTVPVVKFGSLTCSSVAVLSSTTLTCTKPTSTVVGAVAVTVKNFDNQASSLAPGYTYQVAPTVTSVLPIGGPLGGGTTITITGTGFLALPAIATVLVAGLPCTTPNVLTPTSMTCVTPAVTSAGITSVKVTNADLQYGSNAAAFTYAPAPTVASVSPASGSTTGGTLITVTGSGFNAGSVVKVNGVTCNGATLVSSSSITCTTPAGSAGAVAVSVTNLDTQQGSTGGAFTYQAIALLAFQVGTASPTPPNPDSYGSTNTNITHTFTLKNTGAASTTAVSVFLSGTGTAAWIMGTDTCTGAILAQNDTCTIQLTFIGALLGTGSYSAILNATAATGGSVTNSVTGTKIP